MGQDLHSRTFIDVSSVPELNATEVGPTSITVGANIKISDLSVLLAEESSKSQSFEQLHKHMNKIASWNVRNAGSWAGNLVLAREFIFASDLATILLGAAK